VMLWCVQVVGAPDDGLGVSVHPFSSRLLSCAMRNGLDSKMNLSTTFPDLISSLTPLQFSPKIFSITDSIHTPPSSKWYPHTQVSSPTKHTIPLPRHHSSLPPDTSTLLGPSQRQCTPTKIQIRRNNQVSQRRRMSRASRKNGGNESSRSGRGCCG
jgi:hypothetical protein